MIFRPQNPCELSIFHIIYDQIHQIKVVSLNLLKLHFPHKTRLLTQPTSIMVINYGSLKCTFSHVYLLIQISKSMISGRKMHAR